VSGGQDDLLPSLQGFCELLARTITQARASRAALETQGEALGARLERAEGVIGGFVGALQEGEREIGAAHAQAAAALEPAGSGPVGLEGRLDSAEAAFDQGRREAQAELDRRFGRLSSDGFGALGAGLEAMERRTATLQQDSATGSRALSDALAALEAEAGEAGSETAQAVGRTPGEARALADELAGEAAGAREGWTAARAELKRACADAVTDLSDRYSEWVAECTGEGEALVRSVTDAGQEAADFVSADGGLQLEAALDGALGSPLAGLSRALAEATTAIETGERLGQELRFLVPQLEICLNVVENINRLLEEMK
jgi:hypothetical protein